MRATNRGAGDDDEAGSGGSSRVCHGSLPVGGYLAKGKQILPEILVTQVFKVTVIKRSKC